MPAASPRKENPFFPNMSPNGPVVYFPGKFTRLNIFLAAQFPRHIDSVSGFIVPDHVRLVPVLCGAVDLKVRDAGGGTEINFEPRLLLNQNLSAGGKTSIRRIHLDFDVLGSNVSGGGQNDDWGDHCAGFLG